MSARSVVDVSLQLKAAAAVKDAIAKLTDDEDVIRDTLEGETDLDGVLRYLLKEIGGTEAMLEGLTIHIRELKSRQHRFKRRIEDYRALALQAMDIAEWNKRELDVGTLSLGKSAPAMLVTDEAAIPARFWKAGDPQLDRNAVLAALKADETIPGAELKNGAPVLTIRRA